MKLKDQYTYSLVIPTSMGVRITPLDRQPVHTSHYYYMQSTSAESNVGQVAASLGMRVKLLTKFVKGSPIAQFIKNDLRARNIEFEGPDVDQGGPWGYRHQFNIADSGFGMRGPRVLNDRAGEVGLNLDINDYDTERIFGQEGVAIVHMSGLIAAMSEDTSKFCLDIARLAKKHGTKVSFDLNYRASFWVNREKELREIFHEIASLADILIGNEEDFQLALGIQGPPAGGKGLASKIDGFKGMIARVKDAYPNCEVFANTLREVHSANEHGWGALLHEKDNWYVEEPRDIQVLDRIGGGDGFVSGLLYSILKGWEPEKWIQFGWATGCMATTVLEDYSQPLDEDQIWAVYKGNARVKR